MGYKRRKKPYTPEEIAANQRLAMQIAEANGAQPFDPANYKPEKINMSSTELIALVKKYR